MIQVVSFPCPLSNTCEHGISAVLRCDITNQLLNQYGFAYTRTAEQTDLSTLLIRAEQIHDFNAGFQKLRFG